VRFKLAFKVFALAVAAVVAVGVVKLSANHRQKQLEEAFRSLTAGVERLNRSDIAGAQQQFQDSVERFQSLRRDPLIALHHAFAARLQTSSPPLKEVRQLTVPGASDGDVLIDLALSDDSSLLAIATRHRLLCLTLDPQQWVEWPLPHAIERVGALHVDSDSGKVHVVARDDGKLLTADCRAAGSALTAGSSATENRAAVAWLDDEEQMAWVAPANPNGTEVRITARPLPGTSGEPRDVKVSFPGEANSLFPDAAVIHSIGKVDDNILLFYGDANRAHDADLRDESVLVISIDDPERKTNRLVFAAAAAEDENGKTHWRSTHVRRLLPASVPGRVYALTESPQGVAVLGADAKPVGVHLDALFATEYHDGRETYELNVKSSQNKAVMEVGRLGTDTRFSYELPWRSEAAPDLAAISSEGRHVVVANAAGGILLVDLSDP
jgi:hypothetical protein